MQNIAGMTDKSAEQYIQHGIRAFYRVVSLICHFGIFAVKYLKTFKIIESVLAFRQKQPHHKISVAVYRSKLQPVLLNIFPETRERADPVLMTAPFQFFSKLDKRLYIAA